MFFSKNSMNDYNSPVQSQTPDLSKSIEYEKNEKNTETKNTRTDKVPTNFPDPEAMELYSRVKAQEEEILMLREQIAFACLKEMKSLNEKCSLQKKLADLQLAIDEKQNEIITSASNELARRKADLEENLKLVHELKVEEDEKYMFTSSMLGLLAEYGVLPHAVNASSISDSVKHLYGEMQLKIRTSHARFRDLTSMAGRHDEDMWLEKDGHGPNHPNNQLPQRSLGQQYPFYSHHLGEEQNLGNNITMTRNELANSQRQQLLDNGYLPNHTVDNNARNNLGQPQNFSDRRDVSMTPEEEMKGREPSFRFPIGEESAVSDDLPGIDGFQIIGDAKPGSKLLGCGFPVRGTSLCMFQWVHHLQDGTRQYIEGATNPEYVITADDVDKLICVECIPMNDQGQQGELVRIFANNQNKITCEPDMQLEIDTCVSTGIATFTVLLWMDSSENWEPATLTLKRAGYEVKASGSEGVIISEKFSKDVSIQIPSGFTPQFVLTCSDGSSYPFSTYNDVKMRDTLVLTMRMFQSKALDERRKGIA
ncbi:uncharacterized protein LOC124918980 [Impatiens glandulifera]|uniref:uncharacterized protein LOC124918980 n=1 Tax=Impatiens glandulifera TaxID=253017 RepID=UPI001FB16BEC|nr:uncharacterized protein LOC124918980 [Impatiens glandulifera]